MIPHRNRWLIALSGVGIHICIGSVYAWSVFSKPLQSAFGWNMKEANFTFGLAIFTLGISAAVMGHVVERHRPRISGFISTFFWCLGLLGSGFVVSEDPFVAEYRLPLLYLFYGLLGGIGLGTGYVTPVSTLIKWFPDHRGLATGMAIMGFGFASFLGAPIISELIGQIGLSHTFYVLSGVYFFFMSLSSLYLSPPPKGWSPARLQVKTQQKRRRGSMVDLMPMNANQAVRTAPFYGLWIMMFINITCGIAVISVASPMIQEVTGASSLMAATIVGLIGLFNGLGRISWATISDGIGRPVTFILFFALEIGCFLALSEITDIFLFQVLLYLVMTCYGGGFATLPAYIGDIFGTRQVSAIHGYVLTAWAFAGISGSSLAAHIRESTGSFGRMLQIFSGIFILALLVSVLMLLFIKRRRQQALDQPVSQDSV